MPLWHSDYFELKSLKKQQVQEGLSALHPLPRAGREISPEEGALPRPGREEHSHHWGLGAEAEMDLYKQTC